MKRSNSESIDYDNVGEVIHENCSLRKAGSYRVLFASNDLNFQTLDLTDPVPLGRQILTEAGLDPAGGFSLFAILPSGDFEDVRLDEPFDLRGRDTERFIAFQTDCEFKLTLKGKELKWGKPTISGRILYNLAGVSEGEAVFLDVPGGTDKLIEPEDIIDLAVPGIEHFIVGPKPVKNYEIIVNARPKIVDHQCVTFEEIVSIAFQGNHASNIRFSMTYRHAESYPYAGELGPNGTVKVKIKGTIFNVTKTVQS